jgi:predicted nucleic acid-binding protein
LQRVGASAGRAGSRALNLYLDASALVKRYVAEPGSDTVRDVMDRAEGWFMCRVGFVETVRAVGLSAGRAAAATVRGEWPAFGVIEVDQTLVEDAAKLAIARELRSLDALHLAAALMLPRDDLILATWDRRLHTAAGAEGLALTPERLD